MDKAVDEKQIEVVDESVTTLLYLLRSLGHCWIYLKKMKQIRACIVQSSA